MTLSMIPRGIAAALAACSILLVLAAPAAVAGGPIDETTTTAITSPGDPFFTYEDEAAWDEPERGGPQEGDPNTPTVSAQRCLTCLAP